MSIYNAKLYAKNIPSITKDELEEVLGSPSSVTPILPDSNNGYSKNLRSVRLSELIEYMSRISYDESYTKLYDIDNNNPVGSKSGNIIILSESRTKYKKLCFIYGIPESTAGSVIKSNEELDYTYNLSKLGNSAGIRLVELSTGSISITNILEDSNNKTNITIGDNYVDNILQIYGIKYYKAS